MNKGNHTKTTTTENIPDVITVLVGFRIWRLNGIWVGEV